MNAERVRSVGAVAERFVTIVPFTTIVTCTGPHRISSLGPTYVWAVVVVFFAAVFVGVAVADAAVAPACVVASAAPAGMMVTAPASSAIENGLRMNSSSFLRTYGVAGRASAAHRCTAGPAQGRAC